MTKPEGYSTQHYHQSGNFKKSLNKKPSMTLRSENRTSKLKRDKQVIARLNELGYTKGDNGNFPCFCGKLDEDTAWWMSNCKSRSNHLFCPTCTERVFEPEIKETLDKLLGLWKEYKWRMWKADKVSISNLLSKGNNA
jgi:hypothetical protein